MGASEAHSTKRATPRKLERIEALVDPGVLSRLLGPVASVERSSLPSVGFSGSRHERLDVTTDDGTKHQLVVKQTPLMEDWTAYRTGDRVGREALLLGERPLAGVWDVFACPYLAYSQQPGLVGLLMHDLSAYLFPDVDEPIAESQEDALLGALAALHARYWEASILKLPWLMPPVARFSFLGPNTAEEEGRRPPPRRHVQFFAMIGRGWQLALDRLPDRVVRLLTCPPEQLARLASKFPQTLLHGDTKVANFAIDPYGRVVAFDWECVGVGPATLDLGFYLAVNAGRLARPKEAVIARYRELLEAGLGFALSAELWQPLVSIGVLYGAVSLLWAKALARESGASRAVAEWEWWLDQLERQAAR
jgi:hypothetical protein